MPKNRQFPRALPSFKLGLSAILLILLLAAIWLAGGSSRADVMGQAIVRGVAITLMVAAILFGEKPNFAQAKPVWLFLIASLTLVLLQLIPLPPSLWQLLPGRAIFSDAAALSGQPQPWRPWAIVPSAAVNAAGSLIVPLATLHFATGLSKEEKKWLPGLVLTLIVASAFLALLQFSGTGFDNPLINDGVGDVSGTFANRNHLALFLAFGLLLAPIWAFSGTREPGWRGPTAFGLALLFFLTILVSGSRAGIIVALIALATGLLLVWRPARRLMARYPRWVFPALIITLIGMIAIFVLISVAADRAISIDRIFTVDAAQDLRNRSLPTLLLIARTYFPMGYGFGGFDPIFRIQEPLSLLDYEYFNHAHNDLLEIVLEAGLPGALLLLSALSWVFYASVRAWRMQASMNFALPKVGSAILLLTVIASLFDYPARTPIIMTMIVIASIWLTDRPEERGRTALPPRD